MAPSEGRSRAIAIIPIAIGLVLLAGLVWMMATGRVWPSDGPGPVPQTIPDSGATRVPPPAPGQPRSASFGLVFV